MGNNTSATRKSSVSARRIDHSDHHTLADEFNDLVLHKQPSNQSKSSHATQIGSPVISQSQNLYQNPAHNSNSKTSNKLRVNSEKFNNELIEDDLNELDDNLLETPTDLQPNIINSYDSSLQAHEEVLIPVEIKWVNPTPDLDKVLIIGSFTNWRNFIQLNKVSSKEFKIIINLPLGVHKLLYIINNEYKVNDSLPTATDQEGVFFNWFEVINNFDANNPYLTSLGNSMEAGVHELEQIKKKSNSFLINSTKQSTDFEHIEYLSENNSLKSPVLKPKEEFPANIPKSINEDDEYDNEEVFYSNSSLTINKLSTIEYENTIPEMYTNFNFFMNSEKELKEPPQLPPHLNNVLLNKSTYNNGAVTNTGAAIPATTTSTTSFTNRPPLMRSANSQYYDQNSLSIPNHVILNHLITTSIKNDILIVGCINRYSGKFVTQIMYSPVDN